MTDLVELAAQLRDRGMSLAELAQDTSSACWSQRADEALIRVARRMEFLFTDDLRRELNDDPEHFNCWGSVWMRAIKVGVIERTNETRHSAIPALHKHRYPIYRSNLYRGAVS